MRVFFIRKKKKPKRLSKKRREAQKEALVRLRYAHALAWQKYRNALWAQAKQRAHQHRLNPTPAETKANEIFTLLKVPFYREYIHFYERDRYRIVDFYFPGLRLNIEIDGGYHEQGHIKSYDIQKDLGVTDRTIRYRNEDVFKPDFIETVKAALILREHAIYGPLSKLKFKADCQPGCQALAADKSSEMPAEPQTVKPPQ